MTLKEHYSTNSRKSLKPYIKLVILFFIVITISNTYARYSYTKTNTGEVVFAKWNILVNNVNITDSTTNLGTNISLLNSEDNSTNIDSGDECYFDLTINPSTTEVAVSYSINVDLANSNLPSGTNIVKYEKYVNTGVEETLEATQIVNAKSTNIAENISLLDSDNALGDESIRRYRIFFEIPFPIDINKDDELSVSPEIIVKQYID